MILSLPRSHLLSIITLAMAGSVLFAPLARADCNSDLAALAEKRAVVNAMLEKNKKAHAGKIDPIAACPELKSLAAAQGAVVSYMQKNKDWCSLPDELVAKSAQAQSAISGFAVKACGMVVKIKEMQAKAAQQQAAQAAQAAQAPQLKLPTGPL